jgi:murein DD-endopeptidase MepM/ murein hydrolase activator NlpD
MTEIINEPELLADQEPPADLGETGPAATGTPQLDPSDSFDVDFGDAAENEPDPAGDEPDTEPTLDQLGLPAIPLSMLALGAIGPAPAVHFPGRDAFRMGKSNPAVEQLGTMLIERGGKRFYAVGASPTFGRADRNATAAFQRAQGWAGANADGFPGPTTWNLLVTGRGHDIPKGSAFVTSPVPGHHVTFPFHVIDKRYAAGFHTGADYAAAVGTPIVAVVAGVVKVAEHSGAYGKHTFIRGEDGHTWLYAHQSKFNVRVGDHVKAGQTIGFVGATGNVTGPHLHIEKSRGKFWAYSKVIDPTVHA